ncbi:MAG: hypothetical protein MK008_05480 [Bdellovibrionales bacterium]|nr:hypothetical protein [Bdellovibrionales bacterium]
MSELHFVGKVCGSKDQLNRALIVQSFFPHLSIEGDSQCEDILSMKKALKDFQNGAKEIECGDSRTILNYLALRVSRQKGQYILKASNRLFKLRQNDLLKILMQLGCEVEIGESYLKIISYGWKPQGDGLHVNQKQSSEFLSALLLSAWELPQPLFIHRHSEALVSQSYLNLTLSFLGALGMTIKHSKDGYFIDKGQSISVANFKLEPDMSVCYALACHALLRGSARIQEFPHHSVQPDFAFVNLLKLMGAEIYYKENTLVVKKTAPLMPMAIEFNEIPDMFPMTAALFGFFPYESKLYGSAQLSFKESHCVENCISLLQAVGRNVHPWKDGLLIEKGEPDFNMTPVVYDEGHDPRMAMAASLYMAMGYPITINDPNVVNKTYPEFWSSIGVRP